MKKNKYNVPILGDLFKKLTKKIGAEILIEPTWQIAGQIKFKNGTKRYFRYTSIDLNTLGASEIAKDKDYSAFFMKKMGYSVIEGMAFCSPKWARAIGSSDTPERAYRYAVKLGFPVIVKPNSASQGNGVALVHTKTQFFARLRDVFAIDKMALVQRYIQGRDYRIVVLDGKIISAYERMPLSVTGDGKSTILQLLRIKKKYFHSLKRDIKIEEQDPRIKEKLARGHLTLSSKLKRGRTVALLDNANLSTGGDSHDVTTVIHPLFKKLVSNLARDMGLRIAGVDLMIEKGDIASKPSVYKIIEINASPGLDHYVTTGKAQEKIVEDLYMEVLKSMEK